MTEKLGQHVDLEKSDSLLRAGRTGNNALPVIDPIAEAKLVRKLDFYIIPITMLLYLFSFLDRYVCLRVML